MNKKLLNCLKFHQIMHNTTSWMDVLGSWLIACCKHIPTLATQVWLHNYIISCNEYLGQNHEPSTTRQNIDKKAMKHKTEEETNQSFKTQLVDNVTYVVISLGSTITGTWLDWL